MGYKESAVKDFTGQFLSTGSDIQARRVQDLIPIKNILDGMVITKDGRFLKIAEIEAVNFPFKEAGEQDSIIRTFATWLKAAPAKGQIKTKVEFKKRNEYVDRLRVKRQNTTHPTMIKLFDSNINFVSEITNKWAIVIKYYVVIEFERSKRDFGKELEYSYISQQLDNSLSQLESYFNEMGCNVIHHENEDEWLGEFFYDICNSYSSTTMPFLTRAKRILADTDKLSEKREAEGKDKIDIEYVNLIAPMGMSRKTSPDCVVADQMYHSYYYISGDGYPMQVDSGWLTSLFSGMPGIDIDFFYRRENRPDFIKKLSQTMKFTRLKASERSDTNVDFGDILDAAASQQFMMDALTNKSGQEDPFYVVTMFSVHARSYEELLDKCQWLEENAGTNSIKLIPMEKYEHVGFNATLPLNNVPSKIYYKARRNITTSGLAGFFPFTELELNDPNGLFMGINLRNRTVCTLDLYNRNRYANGNMIVLGGSGAGKTYTLQLFSERFVLEGNQVFVITSEKGHEFKRICDAVGGTCVKFASVHDTTLNILDIRAESEVKDILFGEESKVSWLAKKSASVSAWFELLFKNQSIEEKMALDKAVYATYAKFGITKDNRSIFIDNDPAKGKKTMPILEDLLNTLYEMSKEEDGAILGRTISMLKNFISGTFEGFNGQTNIDLEDDKRLIVFDLEDMAPLIKDATIHLVVDLIWGRVKEDPTKPKSIIIEEGWTYLSRGASEASAKQMQEIWKIIRGFGGNAIMATQEFNDIMSSEYGQSIIACSEVKLLMGVSKGESKYFQGYFHLSPMEADALEKYKKGACLLLAGNDRIPIQIKASPYEHTLISTDSHDYSRALSEKQGALQ